MRLAAALLSTLLLTGCLATVPERKFPAVPPELLKACPDLQQVDPNTKKLSDIARTVISNYGQYHECQVRVDAWVEWYTTQKRIFEEVK